MSLKAKLEAVIYAAEEPVTLAQLAQIFAADALEWQAAQRAAAAEANAEFAGDSAAASESLPLIGEGMEIVPVADTAAMVAGEQAAAAAFTNTVSGEGEDGGSATERPEQAVEAEPAQEESSIQAQVPAGGEESSAPGEPGEAGEVLDAEAEARRLARQREREIRGILKQILDEIIATYEHDDRGVEIREIAGGYRMATKPECHDAVRLFVKSLKPPLKLSLPALETLAVVAYKQPVTAPEVSEIRGVESGGVLGSLLARKLIATAGRKQVIGRPILYKTTKEFLLRFGLKDLNELPSMEEFEKMAAAEIEELEPEAAAAEAAAGKAAAEAAEAAAEAEESVADAELVTHAETEAETEAPVERSGEEGTEEASEHAAEQDSEPESEPDAERQAEARADEQPADLEENSPSGLELAETENSEPPHLPETEQASEEFLQSSTDGTSAESSPTSNEQDANPIEPSEAPPAEPELTAPAETEATPDAEKDEQEH